MKQKILEVVYSLGKGGAEKVVETYLLNLDTTKFDLSVLILHGGDYFDRNKLLERGVKIYEIWDDYTKRTLINRIKGKLFSSARLFVFFWSHRNFDVIHLHSEILYVLKPSVRFFGKARFLFTCHNQPSIVFVGKNFKAAMKLRNRIEFFGLTPDQTSEINSMLCISSSRCLLNPVSIQKISAEQRAEKRREIRKKYNIPGTSILIGSVGRMVEQKNHGFLLEIFKDFHKAKNDSYLMLVGDGPLKKNIEKKANEMGLEKNVLFVGNQNEMDGFYSSFDFLCMPSKWEGVPMVLLEAQAMGIPCLISDCIDKESIISKDLVAKESLSRPSQDWADALLHFERAIKEPAVFDSNMHTISMVIKCVEAVYLGANLSFSK